MEARDTWVLGAGMTGLAAGWASGLPVLEAADHPGGICSSYYMRPGHPERLPEAPADGEAYRFEIGGGHWIFGGDPVVLRLVRQLAPVQQYSRRSSVFFPDDRRYVPYPLQNHLHALDPDVVTRALAEMAQSGGPVGTMREWLETSFGPTLGELFFYPFHDLYTAGLYETIAPQDAYKSPVHLPTAIRGAMGETEGVGYNVTFLYPHEGLDSLARALAERCRIEYGRRIVGIDPQRRVLSFADGSDLAFETVLSTLPLNRTLEMAGLDVEDEPDPSTSVLVLNIGARRGKRCPDDHWLYIPSSRSGFHRVGFYSNVDPSFLPAGSRAAEDRVSIYVELAARAAMPDDMVQKYAEQVVRELQDWDFIGEAEAVDPTWIDVAYTWSNPGSRWRAQAMAHLEAFGIHPIGRYARWSFQGIADSIRDGLYAGAAFGPGTGTSAASRS